MPDNRVIGHGTLRGHVYIYCTGVALVINTLWRYKPSTGGEAAHL